MQANGSAGSAAVSGDHNRGSVSADTRGRHRILAELKRLEQEARFLEEELEEIEKIERVSAAMQELLQKVESKPDPLLPITHGPINPSWDRWFEGPKTCMDANAGSCDLRRAGPWRRGWPVCCYLLA